jgi:hypothetical protein
MPRKQAAKPSTASPTDARPARRDLRPYIYLALNQIFAAAYFYIVIAVIPNRYASAAVNLYALPILMQVIALGAATIVLPRTEQLRRVGWWIVTVASSVMISVTIVLIIRVLISAAFLSGVYGAFGKAAATSALIGVALVVELVGLLPLFQLKYMRSRAGRRAYAMGR